MNPRPTARLSSAAIATCAFAVAASAGTVVEARWLAPVSGNWFDGANWTTGVPPMNAEGVLYDVTIDAVGAPYLVRRGIPLSQPMVRNFTMDSPDATMFVPGIVATDTFRLVRGTYRAQTNGIAASQIIFEKDAKVEVSLDAPRTFAYLRVSGPLHNQGSITLFQNADLALTQSGATDGYLRNDGVITLHDKAYIHRGSIENYGEMRYVGGKIVPFGLPTPATQTLVANHGLVSVRDGSRRILLGEDSSHSGEFSVTAAELTLSLPSHINLLEGATFTGEGQLDIHGFNPTIHGDFFALAGLSVRVPTNLTVNGAFTADTYTLFESSPTGSLTVSGATTLRNDVSFTNRTVTSGGLFRVGGSLTATRTGSADGSLNLEGGLSVGGNATISVPTTVGADALFEGNLVQNIAYTQTAGDLTVLGNLTHTGNQRIAIDQGELFVGGNATFTVGQRTLDFDAAITGAASLNAVDVEARLTARRVNALGAIGVRGEVITQEGTFIQRGVFAPGLLNEVGEARFIGDFTLSDNPLLTTRFDLAVDTPRAAQSDSVLVEGDLTLGGAFVLSVAGDTSMLEEGQQWRLFEADSRAGFFSSTTLPTLQGDLAFVLRYDPTGLTLRIVPTPSALSVLTLAGGVIAGRRRGSML